MRLLALEAERPAAHNLPIALTSFVGRDRDIVELDSLVGSTHRLVTFTGPGGVGKTRLALQVARRQLNRFEDGVWLVELAALSSGLQVDKAIAAALGLHDEPDRDLLDTLVAALRPRRVLLVLDNCEHLVQACAELVFTLLSACPRLTVVSTSREPLAVPGEFVWRVPSLELPRDTSASLDSVRATESVRLFVDRVRGEAPRFEVTSPDAPRVARICRQLDGIPLALELAAARVPILGLDELDRRLNDRFRVLTSGTRTAAPRQQTLRATVEWSYGLLNEPERILFQRLSVFAGGWTLAAVEGICADDELPAEHMLDLLGGLVAKSLALVDNTSGATRFRFLETIRQYAAERLQASGAEQALRERHLRWYAELACRAEPMLRRTVGMPWSERVAWVQMLTSELENLRSASLFATGADADLGLDLVACLFPYFFATRVNDGREWLAAMLDRARAAGDCSPAFGRALSAASKLAAHHGDDEAASRQGLEYLGLPAAARTAPATSDVHSALCVVATHTGEFRAARDHAARAIEISEAAGDTITVALVIGYQADVAAAAGSLDQARGLFDQSLARSREIDFDLGAGLALERIGTLERLAGRTVEATSHYEEAMTIFRCMDSQLQMARVLIGLGHVASAEGRVEAARQQFGEALVNAAAIGQRAHARAAVEGFAALGDRWAADALARDSLPLDEALRHARSEHQPTATATYPLTDREVQVASLVARGLSNREIARELVISVRTADRHMENILGKLECATRGQVAVWAVQHGLSHA